MRSMSATIICPKCQGAMLRDTGEAEPVCVNCGNRDLPLGIRACPNPPRKGNTGKFPCPQCGRVLKSAKWLARHIEIVHAPAPPVPPAGVADAMELVKQTSLNHTIQKGEEAFAKVEVLESEPRVVTITIRIEL